jgi:pilus assembly protein Flp/PilA
VIEKLKCFLRNEEGLTIVEYAVAAGLITLAVATAFTTLGGTVNGIIETLNVFLGGVAP